MKEKNLSGKRIKLARIARDMKQVDVRAALSVDHNLEISQASMSELERNRRSISDIELNAFAHVLNVSPLWLLYGQDTPSFDEFPLDQN